MTVFSKSMRKSSNQLMDWMSKPLVGSSKEEHRVYQKAPWLRELWPFHHLSIRSYFGSEGLLRCWGFGVTVKLRFQLPIHQVQQIHLLTRQLGHIFIRKVFLHIDGIFLFHDAVKLVISHDTWRQSHVHLRSRNGSDEGQKVVHLDQGEIWPVVGSISPAKIFKNVDFPAPLAPINP